MGGSEVRAGDFAARKARRAQWEAVRPNVVRLGGLVLVLGLGGIAGGAWVGGWLGGFVSGLVVAAAITFPLVLVPSVTGTVPQMMGASAERDTSAALRRAVRSRGLSFDHIAMKDWEADHLVLSLNGVLVIETKWSAKEWDLASDLNGEIARAVDQVTRVARRCQHLLKSPEVAFPAPIERLVVVWGRLIAGSPSVGEIHGCPVVHGSELRSWVQRWCDSSGVGDPSALRDAGRRLDALLDARDRYDDARDADPWFVREGLVRPVQTVYEGVLGFLAAGILCTLITAWIGHHVLWWWAPVAVVYIAGWFGLRRLHRRPAATGWALGGAGYLLLFAIVMVFTAY